MLNCSAHFVGNGENQTRPDWLGRTIPGTLARVLRVPRTRKITLNFRRAYSLNCGRHDCRVVVDAAVRLRNTSSNMLATRTEAKSFLLAPPEDRQSVHTFAVSRQRERALHSRRQVWRSRLGISALLRRYAIAHEQAPLSLGLGEGFRL